METSLEEEESKRFKDWDVKKVQLIETSKNIFFVEEREYK